MKLFGITMGKFGRWHQEMYQTYEVLVETYRYIEGVNFEAEEVHGLLRLMVGRYFLHIVTFQFP